MLQTKATGGGLDHVQPEWLHSDSRDSQVLAAIRQRLARVRETARMSGHLIAPTRKSPRSLVVVLMLFREYTKESERDQEAAGSGSVSLI